MDLRTLFKNSNNPKKTFKAGDTIFEKDEKAEEFFVILEGEVEIHAAGGTTLDTLGSGEIFGEMAIIDNQDRSASAIAKTDCVLGAMNEAQFLFMVQETPFFALEVMRIITQRLRKTNSTII